MLAQVTVTPNPITLRENTEQTFGVTGSGNLAEINGAAPTWQNLVNCAVEADGRLQANDIQGFATSVETIAAGDGYAEWIVNVAPGSWPAGRTFGAGLTTLSSISSVADVEFAILIASGGVRVLESAVERINARPWRANGVYRVGVEDGQVIYRADGEVIWRSGEAVSYPLRMAAIMISSNDQLGGFIDGSTTYTWSAFDAAGAAAGSFVSNNWTSPTNRGRYIVQALSANNIYGRATANVQLEFPRWTGGTPAIRCPGKFRQLPPEWRVNEQIFDDLAADYLLPADADEPVRRWRLEWGSTRRLDLAEAALLDDFFYTHRNNAFPFYFYDPRANVVWDNVRFARYESDHRLYERQQRIVELIRRPL